jgi:hypothetical protein
LSKHEKQHNRNKGNKKKLGSGVAMKPGEERWLDICCGHLPKTATVAKDAAVADSTPAFRCQDE